MGCAACKGVRGDGNTCRFCGEYSPSDRDRLMAEQNRLIGEQNHLMARIAAALEGATWAGEAPIPYKVTP